MNAFLQASASTAADLPDQDLGPLAWVLDELRKTLDASVKALRRYTREVDAAHEAGFAPPDTAHLRMARQQLHMALGAIEMVGLAQPALMLRAMEQAAQKFVDKPEICTDEATGKVERASFALIDYLEGVLAGKPASPVGLFPQYRDVQSLAGGAAVHPADLWPMESHAGAIGGLVPVPPLDYGPPVRARLDQAVLKVVKTGDPVAAQELGGISLGLAAGQTAPPARAFWTLSAAYFEALGQGLFAADLYAKRIASRVLTQYASLAKGDATIAPRLVQDMLFFCAQAVPGQPADAPTLTAVRQAHHLERHIPVDYEVRRFGRFDPALLAQARKRLAAATETWSALAGGDTHRFKTAHDQFGMVGESLTKLHPESAVLAQALTQAVEVTVRSNAAPPAALGMEVATSVLYLEAAYEELDQANVHMAERAQLLAGRLQRVMRGGQPEPLDPWMEELYHRVSDRQTMGSVVDELRSSLGEVEQTLDQFFRTPREKVPLAKVANQLSQMRGVMSVLGLDQASHAVMRMRETVDRYLTDDLTDVPARNASFDKLGNSLGALGFLIDMLAYQPQLAKKLFLYDEEAGEFKLVMGRTASHHVEEAEAETVAPDAEVAAPAMATGLPGAYLDAPGSQPLPTWPEAISADVPETVNAAPARPAEDTGFPALEENATTNEATAEVPWQGEMPSEPLPLLAEAAPPGPTFAADTHAPEAPPEITLTTDDATLGRITPTLVPVAAPAALAPSADEEGNEDDEELREIFLDEAREVVQTGLAAVHALRGQPTAVGAQTSLRRTFHTLKGSARMVGFNEFGEAGWAMEQLLNSWLAEQAPENPAVLQLADDALRGLSLWVEDIAVGAAGSWRAQPFRVAADALRLDRRTVPLSLSAMGLAEAPEVLPAADVPADDVQQTVDAPDFEETVLELPVSAEAEADAAHAPAASDAALDFDFGDLAMEDGSDAAPALPPADFLDLPPVAFAEQTAFDAADTAEIADELAMVSPVDDFDFDIQVADELPPAEWVEPLVAEAPALIEPAPVAFAEQRAFDEAGAAEAEEEPGETATVSASADLVEPEALPFAEQLAFDEAGKAEVEEGADDVDGVVDEVATASAPDALVEPEPLTFAEQRAFDEAGQAEVESEAPPEAEDAEEAATAVVPADPVEPEPLAFAEQQAFDEASDAEVEAATGEAASATASAELVEPEPLAFADQQAFDAASPPEAETVDSSVPVPMPVPETPPAPAPEPESEPEPPAPPIEEPTPTPPPITEPEPDNDAVKAIGSLRIGIPLYNVYLNEADEWSRRLLTELNEWALELHEPLPDSTVALAHSLAGSSATVGFQALSQMARALEDALSHVQMEAVGTPHHARVFTDAAEDIRRLLHQFAAGFLKDPSPAVLRALRDLLSAPHSVSAAEEIPNAVEMAAEPEHTAKDDADVDPALAFFSTGEPAAAADAVAASATPAPEAEGSDAMDRLIDEAMARAVASGTDFDDDLDVIDVIDADLFPIFEEEASELLPQLGGALRQWRARPENTGARNEVLRALHTLKGSARLAGALRLGELAHRLETAIERLGSDAPQAAEIEPLLSHFDVLQADLDVLRAIHLPGAPGAVVLPLNDEIDLGVATETDVLSTPAVEPVAPLPQPVARRAGDIPGSRLVPPRQMANQSVRVRSQLLDRLVNQAGEVIITRTRLEARLNQLRSSLGDLTGNLERLRQQLREIEVQAESQMQSRLALVKDSAQGFDPLEFDRFTRVQELTRMMAESVNDVATVQRNLQRTVEGTEDDLVAQARQARELQRDLLRTRMVEFEGIAERLYGVVRQASKDTGKQVKLDITGGSIEMDRGVLDRMSPAFEHLLRNAIAHGIELPDARAAAGKPAAGTIRIGLHHEGNDISVTFADDGRGLDLDRIGAKAREQGLVAPDQTLDASETADLIFTPGFSTADQISEISGRGIGMDVVRAEVQALGGRIETATQAGLGTQFKMVLPLTTAVTQVVMLRAGTLSIGVPANLIEIVRRTPAADLDAAYQRQTLDFGGEEVPFFWAGVLLQSSPRSTEPGGKHSPVVVFRSAAQRLALHVDEVLGNQEVVVKNLGPQLSRLPGLSGMSVLASGAVVLIYNPVALGTVYGDQARAWQAAHAAGANAGNTAVQPAAQEVPLVLVVDDSITVRRVTQRLLKREGYRVSLAADGLQALERLREERPALVLSDIEMPRMDGFDLARNIRGDAETKDLPIVMISSRTAEKHREHARSLGVNHYLGKPYPEEELLSLVRRYAVQGVEV